MNIEQFQWLDGNPGKDDCCGFAVRLIEDRIDFLFAEDYKQPMDKRIIGVVVDSMDPLDKSWATVQLSGRAHIYRTSAKSSAWVLLKSHSKEGPHGAMDEYFIR